MDVMLYEFGPTRSARCRWTLLEAGIEYQSVEDRAIFGSDELKLVHPLGKVPAAIIDGKPLFESAAICSYLADHAADADLIAKPGTWGRAQHDQWVAFCLTEMEAWLWSTAINSFVLPEEQRITAHLEQNTQFFKRGAAAMNTALGKQDYLVEDRFTVTDIIIGWTVNWGRRQGHLGDFPNLMGYLDRLLARPHCTLSQD